MNYGRGHHLFSFWKGGTKQKKTKVDQTAPGICLLPIGQPVPRRVQFAFRPPRIPSTTTALCK